MKIYDLNLTGGAATTGTARTQETTGETSARKTGSAGAGGDDRVEFSSGLGRLAKALSAFGSAHSNRVEALAAQYQAGLYRPDAADTARGMISEAVAGAGQ